MDIKAKDWPEISSEDFLLIEKCFKENKDVRIPNPDINHTRLQIAFLLNNAKEIVRIFSGKLNKEIYQNPRILKIISSMKNIKIDIIIEKDPESKIENPEIEVEINKINDESCKEKIPSGHFIVVDSKSYRYEKVHEDNLEGIKGTANANNIRIAEAMEFVFDNILKPCSSMI